MTGDQRLILKIEHAVNEVEREQFLSAFHVLDEILRELEGQSREIHPLPAAMIARPASRAPVAAAG